MNANANNARKTRNARKVESLSITERALAFDQTDIDSMLTRLDDAIAVRDAHQDNGGLSWSSSRKIMQNNRTAIARAFLALNVEPANVLLDRKQGDSLFNAKALKKVSELCTFIATGKAPSIFEAVTRCFVLCAIVMHRNGAETIANVVNKEFISSLRDLDLLVTDESTREAIAAYRGRTVTGGKDTQSSQARRVLEVLNLATIESHGSTARGAIRIHAEHDVYKLFADTYLQSA